MQVRNSTASVCSRRSRAVGCSDKQPETVPESDSAAKFSFGQLVKKRDKVSSSSE